MLDFSYLFMVQFHTVFPYLDPFPCIYRFISGCYYGIPPINAILVICNVILGFYGTVVYFREEATEPNQNTPIPTLGQLLSLLSLITYPREPLYGLYFKCLEIYAVFRVGMEFHGCG